MRGWAFDKQNRPCREPLARPDDPRHYGSDDSRVERDGYTVIARRPRVDGHDEFVSPDRARSIEDIVREYDPMMLYDY